MSIRPGPNSGTRVARTRSGGRTRTTPVWLLPSREHAESWISCHERTNGGTRPTVAGLEFIESARRILEETDAAFQYRKQVVWYLDAYRK